MANVVERLVCAAFVVAFLSWTTANGIRIEFPSVFEVLDLEHAALLPRLGPRLGTTTRHKNHVNLRQTPPKCSRSELRQRLAALPCDPDYTRALSEAEGIECSFLIDANPFLSNNPFLQPAERNLVGCGMDRNGTLCAVHDAADIFSDPWYVAREVIDECFQSNANDMPSRNCSNGCQTALEDFSDRFGCCIHSEEVMESRDVIQVLAPQLWDDCGVIRPDPCANVGEITIPPFNGNVSCSYTCSLNQFHALYCKYQAEKAMDIYRQCGDEKNAQGIAQSCGFNHKGEFCATAGNVNSVFSVYRAPRDELNDEYFLTVYSKCIQFFSNGTCSMECRSTLQDIRQQFGCCFNNLNTTAFDFARSFFLQVDTNGLRSQVTGNNLWSACGVDTPGFCNFPNNASVFDELTRCSMCEVGDSAGFLTFAVIAGGVAAFIVLLVAVCTPIIVFFYHRQRNRQTSKPLPVHTDHSTSTGTIHMPTRGSPDGLTSQPASPTDTVPYYDYILPQDYTHPQASSQQSPRTALTSVQGPTDSSHEIFGSTHVPAQAPAGHSISTQHSSSDCAMTLNTAYSGLQYENDAEPANNGFGLHTATPPPHSSRPLPPPPSSMHHSSNTTPLGHILHSGSHDLPTVPNTAYNIMMKLAGNGHTQCGPSINDNISGSAEESEPYYY